MFKKLKIISLLASVLFVSGCMSNKIVNLSDYTQNITIKENISDVCKNEYNREKPSVAIVNFTNNSNFGVASIDDKSSSSAAGVGFGIIGFTAGAKSSSSSTQRTVDPKLANAFIPLLENMVLSTGGVKLFTREDMGKVNTELKLQDSGLLDPNSVVQFGLTSGVKYLVTGSIDYVDHNFKNYSQYSRMASNVVQNSNSSDNAKLAAAAIDFATSLLDGTNIKTAVTVKIIEVSTGKIVFTQQIQSETKIHSNKKSQYDQLVGAVKDCISKTLPVLQSQFQQHFSLKGYITKIRQGNDGTIAQISLGMDDKIKKGQEFVVVNQEASSDPFTGKESCDLLPTNTKLVVTKHISQNNSWLKFEGENKNLKLLQLVKRVK